METWYEQLGFYNNPLSTKPAAFHDDILGHEKLYDDIRQKISDSSVIGIFGPFGTGKTTVLKRIISDFGGKRRVIYYSCNKSEEAIDFKRLIIGAGNFLQRLFRIKKKNLVLLMDEAEYIKNRDINNLLNHMEHFKSVIFVGKKPVKGVKKLVEHEYSLDDMSEEKAVELVRSRIGDLDIISDNMIKQIFRKDRNPRRFLKHCEDAMRKAFHEGSEVKKEHINKKT
ncbi:MAG: ATP-binding protein [Nanobdellota archaeon]